MRAWASKQREKSDSRYRSRHTSSKASSRSQKDSRSPNREHSGWVSNKKTVRFDKREKVYLAGDATEADSATESPNDEEADDIAAISRDELRDLHKVSPLSWHSDTACSSHLTDKLHLFNGLLTPIPLR